MSEAEAVIAYGRLDEDGGSPVAPGLSFIGAAIVYQFSLPFS